MGNSSAVEPASATYARRGAAIGPALDRLVAGALGGVVAALAAWTLAYHLVLVARWPTGRLAVLWPLACALLGAPWIVLRHRAPAEEPVAQSTGQVPPPDRRAASMAWLLVLWLGVLAACYTLAINRPDSDDIAYYRRAAFQAAHPDRPVILSNLTYDLPLADVVPTQYLVAYELLPAFVGRWTGLDGLSLYYNIFPALAALMLPAIYYLLFRQLGLVEVVAAVAASGSLMFLLLDGTRHWSPGNFALVRLWQGKCLLVTFGLPWLLLLSWRYLERPTAAAWLSLGLAGIAGIGLSASGAFLAPGAVLVAVCAQLATSGNPGDVPAPAWPHRLWHAILSLSTLSYPVITIYLVKLFFPKFTQQVGLVPSFGSWSEVVGQFGDRGILAAYGGLLFGSAWLALPVRQAVRVVLLTLANAAWFFNPIGGTVLLHALGNVYFRFFYLFPVALAAGLALATVASGLLGFGGKARNSGNRAGWCRPAAAMLLCGLFLIQTQPTFSPHNGGIETSLELKRPLEYRFPIAVRRFLSEAGGNLDGRIVLAPWEVAVAAGVTCPAARFVITRDCYSEWSFALASRREEYAARRLAQRCIAGEVEPAEAAAALRRVVADGADAVVLGPGADRAAIVALLESSATPWQSALEAGGYCLLLRRGELSGLPGKTPRIDNG